VAVTTAGTALAGVTLTQVSAGDDSACALGSTGAAYCWGVNTQGQLGNGTLTTPQETATAATTAGTALAGVTLTQVSASAAGDHTCALGSTGAAYCWGQDASGQLGNGTTSTTQDTAVAVTATGVLAGVVLTQVSSGKDQGCALSSAGAAYCWGGNTDGDLGNNSTIQSTTAVAVTATGVLAGIVLTQVTGAYNFACALSSAGAAYCWGFNTSSQLGNPVTANNFLVPVAVMAQATMIASGYDHSCLLRNGKAYCWGDDGNGQLGNGIGTGNFTSPVAVTVGGSSAIPTGTTLTQISAGYGYACALGSTGAAYCWGLNTNGQLGNGTVTSPAKLATAVSLGAMPTGTILTQIAVTVWSAANDSTCALSTAGADYCWGDDTDGELGNGTTSGTAQTTAVAVSLGAMPAGTTLAQVTVGANFACALSVVGAAYCWGLGTGDQLGNSGIVSSNLPVAVTATGALAGVTLFQISSGQLATCTQDTTGAFYCWGGNGNGQLGNGSTTSSAVPVVVQVIIPGPPTGVSATPGDTTATISWTAPASLGTGTLTGYTATATAASGTFTCTTPSAVTCVISGLTDGTTYSVTVVTLTTDGSSLPSSPAVNVEPIGFLSLTSPTSLTWAVTGNGSNQSAVDAVSGDEQLTATDNTVTGNGWHITVSATTFTTGTYTLPNTGAAGFTGSILSSQASPAPTATCVGSCTLPADTTIYPVAITTAASSPTTYTIYDTPASTGEGVMTLGGSSAANPVGWWVQAPASTRAGIYTSTVTLQVVSGP
jgi:alpha-tubulin suppressor-like RCC1 family protein